MALVAGFNGRPARAANLTVSIVGESYATFAFSPDSITVTADDTVTWIDVSRLEPHTVTPDRPSGPFKGTPAHSVLTSGQGHTERFSQPGTYGYHCEIHPFMTGTVVVLRASAVSPSSSPSPLPSPSAVATAAPTPSPTPIRSATPIAIGASPTVGQDDGPGSPRPDRPPILLAALAILVGVGSAVAVLAFTRARRR